MAQPKERAQPPKVQKAYSPSQVERALPHNLDAEKSILGAILVNEDAYETASDRIESKDFYRDAHRRIFDAMSSIVERGSSVDFVTLRTALEKSGELEECGGPAYLTSLADGMPRSANVRHYCDIVKEAARLRDAIHTATRLRSLAYDAEQPAAEIVADAAERLFDIGGAASTGKPVLLSDLMTPCMAALEQKTAAGGGVTGLATGFAQLDEMTAGLHPSNLVVVGARSSQGKTALALNICDYVASSGVVLMFSLEMAKEEIFERMLASAAGVDSHRLRTGYMTENEWTKIANAMQKMTEMRLYIDDDGDVGVREIRSRARQMQKEIGLNLIVVDYMQLMKARGKFDTRSQEVGSFSRGLKRIAKELKVPVVALSQLSRGPEAGPNRKARRPQMSDLRESGDIEADADVVVLIYRPEPKDDEQPTAELIIAKQRNGPTGTIKVQWHSASVTFIDSNIV